MELPLLLVYALSVFMLIITPGPVVALVINTTLTAGPQRALLTALGTNWAALVLILLAALILAGTVSLNPLLLNGVSLVGCLFIGYLALHGLKDALSTRALDQPFGPPPTAPTRNALLTGFWVGISNPKDIIFFVSFFPQFIHVTPSFKGSITLLSLVWIVIDLSILAAYIVLMRRPFALKYRKGISVASSLTLLAVALGGLFYSVQALLNA